MLILMEFNEAKLIRDIINRVRHSDYYYTNPQKEIIISVFSSKNSKRHRKFERDRCHEVLVYIA